MSLRDTRDIGTAKIVMVGGGGGGGASSLADLTDTSISSPSNGQVLEYNGTSGKWENKIPTGYTAGSGIDITNNAIVNTRKGALTGVIDSISSGYAHTQMTGARDTFTAGALIVVQSEASGSATNLRIQYGSQASDSQDFRFYDTAGQTTTLTIASGETINAMIDSTGYRAIVLSQYKAVAVDANTGTPTAELKKLKVGSTVYNANGIKHYSATAISNGSISVSVPNAGHLNGEIIAVNTGSYTGTTSNAWTLALSDGMTIEALTVSKADGTAFTDAITANELLFIKCNTSNDTAVLLGIVGVNGDNSGYGYTYAYNIFSMSTETPTSHDFIVQAYENYNKNGLFFISVAGIDGTTSSTWRMVLTNPSVSGATISRTLIDMDMNNYTADLEEGTTLVIDVDGQYAMVRGVLRYDGGSGASALSDLTDTSISTPTNGQALIFDGTESKWKNRAISVGVTDVSWDSTNKKLKQTKNGSTTDIVTGSTILDGLTSSQVTTALGYTPPQQDTNTHRPIKVNGTQVLGDNVTPLNLVAGANVTLTESSGSVQISASGGGSGGASSSKTRYQVQASSWSSGTDEDGYHELTINTSPVLSDSFSPNISIANNSSIYDNIPTASEIYAFECIDKANMQNNALVLYAKVKPTTDFWIWVEGDNA